MTSRWVRDVKQLPHENDKLAETAKARLLTQKFEQGDGIVQLKTFAFFTKFSTIQILLALVAHFDSELHQMDVANAFLNGDLDEDIYVEQPGGCMDKT